MRLYPVNTKEENTSPVPNNDTKSSKRFNKPRMPGTPTTTSTSITSSTSSTPFSTSNKGITNRITIDIVTGKELQSIYFDPTLAIGFSVPDDDWLGMHLYLPANVISINEEQEILTIKLPSGESFKVPKTSATYISNNDDKGIPDILKLHDFSEMSLIHNLRVRYLRDEIYTFVGPILISVNPYKWLPNLYNEEAMVGYHSRQVEFFFSTIFLSSFSILLFYSIQFIIV